MSLDSKSPQSFEAAVQLITRLHSWIVSCMVCGVSIITAQFAFLRIVVTLCINFTNVTLRDGSLTTFACPCFSKDPTAQGALVH